MSDDAFSRNTNEVGSELFFAAAEFFERFTPEEVIVGMATALAQTMTGRTLSPATIGTVVNLVASGIDHAGPEFSEAMETLAKLAAPLANEP
jgi:hypothetical protein